MNCFKVVFSLFLVFAFVMPGAVSAMPAAIDLPDSATYVVEIPLTDTMQVPNPAAPPPVEVSVNVKANKAVFIDEENPTVNMNGGAQGAHLRVGTSPEFGYKLWTLLSFSPIKKAQGGPLPNDAEVTRAQIKLYKESGQSGTINAYRLRDDFNEGTVKWNNKPGQFATAEGNANIPNVNGWCYVDVNAAPITDAVTHSNPVRLVLSPTWTNAGKSISFQSDEHPSLGPVLVIYYKGSAPAGAAPAPEPTPTPSPPTGDTTPANLTYTVTPTNPRPGQQITVTARATDNQAMYYLVIMRGSTELARRDAAPGQRELEVSFTETAQLPSMNYQIFADDLGTASAVGRTVTVPVTGSGTAPTVTVTIEWLDVERVVPDRYRLVKNDGQQVLITAEASDPDGIRNLHIFINGTDHPFNYTDETSVSETVGWENNEPSRTRFYYYAQATDREGQTTTGEGGDYHIAQPQDIRLIWDATPSFVNFGVPTLSWERMCQIFSDAECWSVKSWGWKDVSAENYWDDHVKGVADGGCCFGFATMASEIYNGRISPSDLEMPLLTYQLHENSSYTREWIEARQGGQQGEEVEIPLYDRQDMGPGGVLMMVENALESDDPGVICIWEGDGGHAVVPWMIRYMPDETANVYIYDCNKVSGIRNASADINTFGDYPYLVIDGDDWSYQWNSTTVWNDDIAYVRYTEACGDMDQGVDPRLGPGAPYLSDHDIPNSTDWYVAWVTPGADAYFEDEEGNVTGIYKGQLKEEIPGSMAVVPMMAGSFTEHEMYIIPRDKKLAIHTEGASDGEYNLDIMGDGTFYGIKNKRIRSGFEDLLFIEPWDGSLNMRLRVKPGVADDNFSIIIGAVFAGTVPALGEESIDREYDMENVEATENSDFSVYVEEGGGTFVVESYGDDIQFDAVTRSTESANVVDPNTDPGYVPSSVQEDITVEEGRRAEITPETWSSDEERGTLHTLGGPARGEGGGFPWVPVIIGIAVIVVVGVVVGVLFGKGILGKKAAPARKVSKGKGKKAK